MPRAVDASSFKSGGGGGRIASLGGSSDTSNTYSVRQVVVKGPAPGLSAQGRPSSSSSSQARLKLNHERISAQGGANLSKVASRNTVASLAASVASATSLEVPVRLSPEEPSAEKRFPSLAKKDAIAETSDLVNNFPIEYTVRRSPLAQNPFLDPSDEDWPMRTNSDSEGSTRSSVLNIVNPDTGGQTQGDEQDDKQDDEQDNEQGDEKADEKVDEKTDEKTDELQSEAPEQQVRDLEKQPHNVAGSQGTLEEDEKSQKDPGQASSPE